VTTLAPITRKISGSGANIRTDVTISAPGNVFRVEYA
jgi:hypothetical protein